MPDRRWLSSHHASAARLMIERTELGRPTHSTIKLKSAWPWRGPCPLRDAWEQCLSRNSSRLAISRGFAAFDEALGAHRARAERCRLATRVPTAGDHLNLVKFQHTKWHGLDALRRDANWEPRARKIFATPASLKQTQPEDKYRHVFDCTFLHR